ncbi:MAG: hypothetical protein WBD36_02925 [Bacteroidota bacterium]
MKPLIAVLVSLSFTITLVSCRGETQKSSVSFDERLLATIPADLNIVSNDDVVFSPDGRSVAYTAERDRKHVVVVNNARQSEYDWTDKPVFSPDGKKVAYVAVTDVDWKRWLDPSVPNFERGGKWWVINNGKSTGPYDYAWLVSYSPDGSHVAFAAMKGKQWFVVNGEKTGATYEWVTMPLFSSDGHIAYSARSGKLAFMVVDTAAGPSFDEVGDPYWSPDGKKLTYPAQSGNQWYAIVDTGRIGPFDRLRSFWYRNDGTLGFVANRKDKAFVVVGTEEHEAFDDVLDFRFSDDGSAMVWDVKKEDSAYVVAGTTRAGPFRSVTRIALSSNGSRLAYVSFNGKYVIVLNGKTVQETTDMPISMEFSPDGRNLVYILVGDEDKCLGVNGMESTRYDDVRTYVLSPDAKKVALGIRAGNGLWWKVQGLP